MDKKKLAIIGTKLNDISNYGKQVKSLFGENVFIEEIYVCENKLTEEINADLVLLSSYKVLNCVRGCISKGTDIIMVSRTISRLGLDRILKVKKGTKAMLLDDSFEGAMELISILHQLGVRHIDIVPCYPGMEYRGKDIDTTIVLGQPGGITIPSRNIIDIGGSYLDINTIIDMGVILDLDHIIEKKDITQSLDEIVTVNIGLSRIIGKTNKFDSQLDIMLQIIGDGIIVVNSEGVAFSYNESARKIVGYRNLDIIGKNILDILPQIPFVQVLKTSEAVRDKLIKINGNDIIVSVDPIMHSYKLYGAVARLKKFIDAERAQHKLRAQLIGKGHRAKYSFDDIIGVSEVIKRCIGISKRMASSDFSILITGESGTGKELFAQAIHNSSQRRDYQFVAVNCGALPDSLLESELFGYEEGAFTGARKGGKPGLFELAHKGTIFLDEIGEMPLHLQMRLLRVLQEREVMRIGGDRVINIDIRVIAATNRDLKEMIIKGEFREDLYYRLNVLPLRIPPLRERPEDVLLLVEQIAAELNYKFTLTPKAESLLTNYFWKGNVRELRNLVEYIVSLGLEVVDYDELPIAIEVIKEEILSRGEKEIVEKFLISIGKSIQKYIFVLEQLENSYVNRKRLGRRSIYIASKEKGFLISEQEARSILVNLEDNSMVEIFKGRSGSTITDFGRRVYQYMKNG